MIASMRGYPSSDSTADCLVTGATGLVGNNVVDEQNFDLFRLPRSWDDIRNGTAFRGAGQRFRLEAAPGTQLQRYTAMELRIWRILS